MFAVIKTGGKQYTVQSGETLRVEKLESAEGSTVNFDVLLLGETDGSTVDIGAPIVEGAAVTATVLAQGRSRKILVKKYKNKTRYSRTNGHRQPYTEVRIETITA